MNTMPVVFSKISVWQSFRNETKSKSLGFVPTMGALHAGHASLLQRARRENDLVLLSIYVNPTQFDNSIDLKNYPQSLDQDLQTAADAGVDAVLIPDYREIYADEYRYRVHESIFSNQLCGAHRPGHFDGVLTIVLKLLNIAQADRAYFGEKDHQQFALVKDMAEAFFLPTQIISCPTVREADGLAMSSRNLRLDPSERLLAPKFHAALVAAPTAAEAKKALENDGFKVDYVEDIAGRRYGAARLGQVRLIDNVTR